jgi:hypothetical protein
MRLLMFYNMFSLEIRVQVYLTNGRKKSINSELMLFFILHIVSLVKAFVSAFHEVSSNIFSSTEPYSNGESTSYTKFFIFQLRLRK